MSFEYRSTLKPRPILQPTMWGWLSEVWFRRRAVRYAERAARGGIR
jgi:hypothetical protein